MAENFASLPIIDFNDALSPTTKTQFLSELRHALVREGWVFLLEKPHDSIPSPTGSVANTGGLLQPPC
jgi:hypothetical protein